tara:strand:- start:66 stop:494 length:429 start_codon:yes stop_codon:yes gene_type:complete
MLMIIYIFAYTKINKMTLQQFSNEDIRVAIKELLSGQKVELALLDDIKKTGEKLEKMYNAALKVAVEGATKLSKKVDEKAKDFNENTQTLISEINKFEKTTKQLGINPNDIPNYKRFTQVLKQSKGRSKELSRIAGAIRNVY